MKTVALYLRVSTVDQHPETQLHDLRAMAQQRGFQIVAPQLLESTPSKSAVLAPHKIWVEKQDLAFPLPEFESPSLLSIGLT